MGPAREQLMDGSDFFGKNAMTDPVTSSKLLQQIKEENNPQAWSEFCEIYEPFLRRCVRLSGVPGHDVDDLTQTALMSLFKMMPQFAYDRGRPGGFRALLRRIVRSKIADYWRSRRCRPPHTTLLESDDPVENEPGQEFWDLEYHRYLLDTLMARVKEQVRDEETWRVFLLYVLENKTAEDVGREVGISPGGVAGRAWRVMEKLREMARRIDPDLLPKL